MPTLSHAGLAANNGSWLQEAEQQVHQAVVARGLAPPGSRQSLRHRVSFGGFGDATAHDGRHTSKEPSDTLSEPNEPLVVHSADACATEMQHSIPSDVMWLVTGPLHDLYL